MVTLETQRLILRKWELTDIDDLFEYAQNELVGPSAGWAPHKNIEESRCIIEMFIESNEVYAVVLKSENKVIGSLGLHKQTPGEEGVSQKEIGYVLSPSYWGQGLIPEAVKRVMQYGFEELNLEILWCGHFYDNHKSRRVNEKCGFNYQFTLNKSLRYPEGAKTDILYYNIKKQDYFCK